jgi:hypothetical protein
MPFVTGHSQNMQDEWTECSPSPSRTDLDVREIA